MPTPMKAYAEAAAKFGHVDPDDAPAVQRFYVEVYPTLEEDEQDQILAFLLEQEGVPSDALKQRSASPPIAAEPRVAIFDAIERSFEPVATAPRKSKT